jgi:hypothetical protein
MAESPKKWNSFRIWRGRLPHWRAEGVNYYLTFRHRRDLEASERQILLRNLIRAHGKKLDIAIACVLPEKSELIFQVPQHTTELSDIVEKAKGKAGKEINKLTGEKYPPFYTESYDHIIRDESSYQEFFDNILSSPVDASLCEEPEEYEAMYVANAP